MQGEDFYTVEEAARALKLTPDRIRQMLRDGEIEGVPPLEGGASGWKIPVRVVQDRDRPPLMVRPEAPAVGSESLPGPEDTSGLEDMRGEEAPSPTPAQPEREDAAVDSREPTKPPTPHISVREAARNLETSVEALLDAKDQTIADLRDRVAFLERQLEGRGEEIRRRDHIFAALTERIPPAIEAPDHEKPTRTPESTAEEPTRATPLRAGAPRGARGVRGGAARSGDSRPPRSRGKTGSLPEHRGLCKTLDTNFGGRTFEGHTLVDVGSISLFQRGIQPSPEP